MKKGVFLPIENTNDYWEANWFQSARYQSGEGFIVFKFAEDLMPYLLQLKKDFTSYQLENVLVLNSPYAIRIYEITKKWQRTKSFVKNLEEIRENIGATGTSYKTYGNFKNRILNPAINEINEKNRYFYWF